MNTLAKTTIGILAVLLVASAGLNAYNYFISSKTINTNNMPNVNPKVTIQLKDKNIEFVVSNDTTIGSFKKVESQSLISNKENSVNAH